MSATPPARLRFDHYELDPASGELWRDGEARRLEPQPARALAYLLTHCGEVVPREALQREIWGDATQVDFDRGLAYCIKQIRDALEDSAAAPRFVETLPKRGYRFLLPVLAAQPAAPRPGGRARAWALGAVALLALLAVLGLLTTRWSPPTIAVALFDDETPGADGGRLAQALTDAVVERLAREPGRWSVIGNAAALRVPRQARDLNAIAASLGADLVVLGQLQQLDGKPSVLAHLIRAKDQKHLWVGRFAPGPGGEAGLVHELAAGVEAALAERAGR